jgi:hypothetical protein
MPSPLVAIIYYLNLVAAIESAAKSHQVALRFEGVACIVHSLVAHRLKIFGQRGSDGQN